MSKGCYKQGDKTVFILENGRHRDSDGPMESFTFVSLDGPCLIMLCTGTYSIALLLLQL